MGSLDLSVKVLNISTKATPTDLITFFSYCGTIDDIQLKSDGDQSQSAVVTFRQLYAFQTALLLNDAIIVDRRIRIMPQENGKNVPITSSSLVNMKSEAKNEGGPNLAVQAMAFKGQEVLNKAKERVSDTGRTLTNQANSAILAAEQTVGHIGSTIRSSDCFSKGAQWLSGILDKASKSLAELHDAKDRETNSRKQ